MSTHANKTRMFEAGFTLIEMLVVLAILALTLTFAAPLLSGGSDGLHLDTAASDIVAAFRLTRSAAIMRNAETTLMIDVDRRTFESTVVSKRSFSKDIKAKLTFASGVNSVSSNGGFRFFPDGSSTGGDVTLASHGKQTKLCVDWLTGTVRQGAIC